MEAEHLAEDAAASAALFFNGQVPRIVTASELERAPGSTSSDPGTDPIRRLLVALVVIGSAGLLAELLLLEHTETGFQWVPLVILGATLVITVLLATRPSPRLVRVFRTLMIIAVLAGALGVYLHYDGNTEFELEMDPEARGLGLLWSALHGATPALAPGALVQIGLLGLISTYRHPLLRRPA